LGPEIFFRKFVTKKINFWYKREMNAFQRSGFSAHGAVASGYSPWGENVWVGLLAGRGMHPVRGGQRCVRVGALLPQRLEAAEISAHPGNGWQDPGKVMHHLWKLPRHLWKVMAPIGKLSCHHANLPHHLLGVTAPIAELPHHLLKLRHHLLKLPDHLLKVMDGFGVWRGQNGTFQAPNASLGLLRAVFPLFVPQNPAMRPEVALYR